MGGDSRMTQATLRFDGPDIAPEDAARLGTQLYAVRALMLDGRYRTLSQIAMGIGANITALPGISARLRDLRKPRFGGYDVERRRVEGGLWEYRVRASQKEVA
jgi:hypothetical protein